MRTVLRWGWLLLLAGLIGAWCCRGFELAVRQEWAEPVASPPASCVHQHTTNNCKQQGKGKQMKILAKVLYGTTATVTTKKGSQLQKTRLKVQDVGEEVNGDLLAYWIDLLGDSALSEAELTAVLHEEVEIDIKRIAASAGQKGGVFLNLTGGWIYRGGKTVQGTGR